MSPDKKVWLYSASNHSRRSFWLVFGYRRFQAWREAFREVGTGCHGGILANRTPCSQPRYSEICMEGAGRTNETRDPRGSGVSR